VRESGWAVETANKREDEDEGGRSVAESFRRR